MATNTYIAIDKKTLSSPAATVEFTSIPQTYTDLVLIVNSSGSGGSVDTTLRVNGDSASNYSRTYLYGDGTNAVSGRNANLSQIGSGINVIHHFMNYSNTSMQKNVIGRYSDPGSITLAQSILWRSSAAINAISISILGAGQNFNTGSTFSLYGIKEWINETTPKATGGYVTSDSTYYYHSFPFSGTFTPSQSINADILVVAGGGGGAGGAGSTSAGGGGGGYRAFTSQSLSSGITYTCTIGSGGVGGTAYTANASNGTNSSFAGSGFTTISATGGGGGGAYDKTGNSGGSGGGGGGAGSYAGGAGNAGSYSPVEGYAGGSGLLTYPNYCSGGGGGAGGVGGNATTTSAGVGGAGIQWLNNNYYAGGGGGSSNNGLSQNAAGGIGGGGTAITTNSALLQGAVSTGGGGAGITNLAGNIGGAGGSGIVIVRYAK